MKSILDLPDTVAGEIEVGSAIEVSQRVISAPQQKAATGLNYYRSTSYRSGQALIPGISWNAGYDAAGHADASLRRPW